MRYIYIHGFNSGPQSRSGGLLSELLGTYVFCPRSDYSRRFAECLQNLEKQILAEVGDSPLCLMGTSLGGFYALQLRLPQIVRVAAWNPVIFPALQLAQFLGENTRFTDGQKWHFSREAQLSYAEAEDPRVWEHPPERKVFVGDSDELLDHELSLAYWRGHAPVEVISSGHSVADFGHARDYLKTLCQRMPTHPSCGNGVRVREP